MQRVVKTYEQAIEYLYGRINYERVHIDRYAASDFKLDRMRQLLSLLGDPHLQIPAVHIAGTKGKGSTATMIRHMLSAGGYKVGLFISPHISAFEERMTVGGISPTAAELIELVNTVAGPVAEIEQGPGKMSPTYFEIATAMAWLFFNQQDADLVILEVGLGGRLDSTNLCRPEVSLITSISRDHMHLLGSTLAQIAREKAGIIKPGVPVISGVSDEDACSVIAKVCQERKSSLDRLPSEIRYRWKGEEKSNSQPYEREEGGSSRTARIDVETPWSSRTSIPLPLVGKHQGDNAALAVAAIDRLKQSGYSIPESAIYEGMKSVQWPLRIEVLGRRPTVIVDAAHNWESIKALLETLERQFPARRKILVFATTKDKDVSGLFRLLLTRFDSIILTQYLNNPRTVPVEELFRISQRSAQFPVHRADNPSLAWKLAKRLATSEDLICVTGSFFIAAEMREIILDSQRTSAKAEPQITEDSTPR